MVERTLSPERLKAMRESRGITAPELAQIACLDKSTYYRYEQGMAVPSGPTLRLLSLFLGTSMAYLCGKTDDPTPDLALEPVDPGCVELMRDFAKLDEDQKEIIRGIIKIFRRQQ